MGRRPARFPNIHPSNSQRFAYDDLNRLKCWVLNAASCTATDATYDKIGNLLTKTGVGTYTYGANGNGTGAGPHQARTVAGGAYSYDANGNLTSGGGRTYAWDGGNLLSSVNGSEFYLYDADGERVLRRAGGATTVYFQGMWENIVGGATRRYYSIGGLPIGVRDSGAAGLSYLHSDHLGSASLATSGTGTGLLSQQEFTPWGSVRTGSVPQTTLSFTGQRLDSTGLLYYHARYYDPVLARFVSADTVVPGNAAGDMDGVALRPLTVGFHEPGFIGQLTDENGRGFWFQLSDEERQQAGSPWGPASPQALNRYSYVQNNPVRWTDPSGHGQAPYEKNGGGAAGGGGGGGGGIKLPSPRGIIAAVGRFLKGVFAGASADGNPTNEAKSVAQSAYEVARAGGKHAGFLREFANKTASQLEKGMNRLERAAELHRAKLSNPAQYAENWGSMSPEAQQGLLRYWQKEINNYSEQAEILRKILAEKLGGT